MTDIHKKCHLKSGAVTENIIDNNGVVSGLAGCPTPDPVLVTDCALIDKDLGGDELRNIYNVETWQDCGNSMNIFFFVFSFLLRIMIFM